MILDNRALLAFLSLTRTLSFTRSAHELGLTQPRLSYLVRKLEAELGFDLFHRTTRRVEITPAGETVLPRAVAVEEALLALDDATHRLRGQMRERLRVGMPRYTARLPARLQIIETFRKEHPGTRLDLVYGRSVDLLESLRTEALDVAFVTGPASLVGLQSCVLDTARLVVVMPKDHPLTRYESVPLAALKGEQIACPPRSAWVKQFFDRRYAKVLAAGASLVEAAEDDAAAVLHLAAERNLLALGQDWPHWTNNSELGLDYRRAGWPHRPLELHIVRRAPPHAAPLDWIWSIAEGVAARGRVGSGPRAARSA